MAHAPDYTPKPVKHGNGPMHRRTTFGDAKIGDATGGRVTRDIHAHAVVPWDDTSDLAPEPGPLGHQPRPSEEALTAGIPAWGRRGRR